MLLFLDTVSYNRTTKQWAKAFFTTMLNVWVLSNMPKIPEISFGG